MTVVSMSPTGERRLRRSFRALPLSLTLAVAMFGSVVAGPIPEVSAIINPVNEAGRAGAPYALVIMVDLGDGTLGPQPFCSGALIAPDLVLTAAHCAFGFAPTSLFVGAGSENLFNVVPHRVADLVVHHGYDSSKSPSLNPLANDIALLRLTSPVKGVTPIRLAPVQDAALRTPASSLRAYGWGIGADGTASGWLGRAAQTDITARTASPYAELDITRQILVRARRGSTPCIGDSGGPLVGNRAGKKVPVLVGLVSYGSDECAPRMPIVYTRIAGQRSWIDSATQTLRNQSIKTQSVKQNT